MGLDDASLDARLTDANDIQICRLRGLEPFKEIEREQRRRNGTEWCSRLQEVASDWDQNRRQASESSSSAEGTPELWDVKAEGIISLPESLFILQEKKKTEKSEVKEKVRRRCRRRSVSCSF